MAAQQLKLSYFNIPARAFPIRFCLRVAGIPFEDERITGAELGTRRGPTGVSDIIPLGKSWSCQYLNLAGQLPVLYIDGKPFVESLALSRWAAKKANLVPADDVQALVVDEVATVLDECWGKVPRSTDPEQLKIVREAYAANIAPKFLDFIDRRVAEHQGPFVLGAQLSLADLWITAFALQLPNYDHMPKDLLQRWPRLSQLVQAVQAHPSFVAHGLPL